MVNSVLVFNLSLGFLREASLDFSITVLNTFLLLGASKQQR